MENSKEINESLLHTLTDGKALIVYKDIIAQSKEVTNSSICVPFIGKRPLKSACHVTVTLYKCYPRQKNKNKTFFFFLSQGMVGKGMQKKAWPKAQQRIIFAANRLLL